MYKNGSSAFLSTSKRLLNYSACAAALMVVAPNEISAQTVLYEDPSPDLLFEAPDPWGFSGLSLDVDMDGFNDVAFFVTNYVGCSTPWTTTGTFCNCNETNSGSAFFPGAGGGEVVAAGTRKVKMLNLGDEIGPDTSWDSFGILKARYAGYVSFGDSCSISVSGNWKIGTGFMGFRLPKADGLHYGWLEIEMFDFDTYSVKSYAYHTEPDVPIKAGETCSPPQNLTTTISSISGANSVTLNWDSEAAADGYRIMGRVAGSSSFVKVNNSSTSRTFADLAPNSYEWTVLSICGAQKSPLAPLQMFTITAARRADDMRRVERPALQRE